MVKRVGGSRKGSRNKFKKDNREKGKISTTRYFREFDEGDRVILDAEPAVQKGLYHRRFHSKVGEIIGKRGECYEVEIKDGDKKKMLIIHPVHLRPIKEEQDG